MSRILVTGANGFVGRVTCDLLLAQGHRVIGLVRRAGSHAAGMEEWLDASGDFSGIDAAWPDALVPDCVVHLAARVHIMNEDAADPEAAFRATNVDATLRLAAAARRKGVRRFVFVSSIKAVAEGDGGVPLRENAPPAPRRRLRPLETRGRRRIDPPRRRHRPGNRDRAAPARVRTASAR